MQMGRLGSTMSVANPSSIQGQSLPAIQCTIGFVSKIAHVDEKKQVTKKHHFMQVEARGSQSMAAHKWTSVNWNHKVPLKHGMSVSGTTLTFSRTGVFQISLAYRPGSGGDVWTSARVFDGKKSVGHGVGHGHPGNDPALITLTWLFKVADTKLKYQLQVLHTYAFL